MNYELEAAKTWARDAITERDRLKALNAELVESVQWAIALCEETGATATNAYASACAVILKAGES
jgi:hypothetical protein